MRAHGPRRMIVGEFLHSDGELYAILECGHAVLGKYDSDGMPMTKRRMCMHCAAALYYGGQDLISWGENFGFIRNPEPAIKEGKNVALWSKITDPKFGAFNKKHLDQLE